MFVEIIAAAADYEQSGRTHLMPRQQRQFGYAAAQNWGICSPVPCRGRPCVNREYSAIRSLRWLVPGYVEWLVRRLACCIRVMS
jgi:hypothetical protein